MRLQLLSTTSRPSVDPVGVSAPKVPSIPPTWKPTLPTPSLVSLQQGFLPSAFSVPKLKPPTYQVFSLDTPRSSPSLQPAPAPAAVPKIGLSAGVVGATEVDTALPKSQTPFSLSGVLHQSGVPQPGIQTGYESVDDKVRRAAAADFALLQSKLESTVDEVAASFRAPSIPRVSTTLAGVNAPEESKEQQSEPPSRH